MSRGFEDFFHWRGGSFHWHGGFTVERTARLPGGGQGRGPAQSCEGRGPPSLHPPPWPRYTLRVLLVCLLRGLAHSVRSACGVAGACSLRSLRVWGCGGLLTSFAPRAGLLGLAHSVRSACGAAWASSLRSLRVRGCVGLLTPFAPRAGLRGLAHSVRSACVVARASSLRSLRVRGCLGLLTSFAPRAGLRPFCRVLHLRQELFFPETAPAIPFQTQFDWVSYRILFRKTLVRLTVVGVYPVVHSTGDDDSVVIAFVAVAVIEYEPDVGAPEDRIFAVKFDGTGFRRDDVCGNAVP